MEMQTIYQNDDFSALVLKPASTPYYIVQWNGKISKAELRRILVRLYACLQNDTEHHIIFNLTAATGFPTTQLTALLPQFLPKLYQKKRSKIAIVMPQDNTLSQQVWITLSYLAHLEVKYFSKIQKAQEWLLPQEKNTKPTENNIFSEEEIFEPFEETDFETPIPSELLTEEEKAFPKIKRERQKKTPEKNSKEKKKNELLKFDVGKKRKLRIRFKIISEEERKKDEKSFFDWLFK